jgi:class 3 adenylate cyclase
MVAGTPAFYRPGFRRRDAPRYSAAVETERSVERRIVTVIFADMVGFTPLGWRELEGASVRSGT